MTFNIELRDRSADLSSKAFKPFHVHNDSLIHAGNNMKILKYNMDSHMRGSVPSLNNPPVVKEDSSEKVDLLIHYLCHRREDRVHNMIIMNTDASYYLHWSLENFL